MTEHHQKSWFARNWPWAIPLGGCLTFIIVIIVFASSVIFGVNSLIKSSTPYQDAIIKANTNEYVDDLFGTPIESDGMPMGNISLNNDDGEIDMEVPIKGKKKSGTLHIKGTKTDGDWNYEYLYLASESGNEEINLLNDEY